jgi:hypothetical protein
MSPLYHTCRSLSRGLGMNFGLFSKFLHIWQKLRAFHLSYKNCAVSQGRHSLFIFPLSPFIGSDSATLGGKCPTYTKSAYSDSTARPIPLSTGRQYGSPPTFYTLLYTVFTYLILPGIWRYIRQQAEIRCLTDARVSHANLPVRPPPAP